MPFRLGNIGCWLHYPGRTRKLTLMAPDSAPSSILRLGQSDGLSLGTFLYIHIVKAGEKNRWNGRQSIYSPAMICTCCRDSLLFVVPRTHRLTPISFMMPCTPHAVLTGEECIALGGHFYNSGQFKRTTYAMVYEHFCGNYVCNAAHPRAPLLLFKALSSYADEMLARPAQKRLRTSSFPVPMPLLI